MMKLFKILFLLLAAWCSACTKENSEPSTDAPVEISSQTFSNKTEHWTNHNKNGVDYVISEKALFQSNSILTIDPGVEILFKNSARLEFNNATLKAIGTATSRIIFRGETATPGFWECIVFYGHTDHEMAYCTVSDAGGDGGNGTKDAALVVGTALSKAALSLQNCEIRNAANYGLYVHFNSDLTLFNNNVVAACDYPAYVHANSLGQLKGIGNNLTSNRNDWVMVDGSDVERISVWPNLGLPFLFMETVNLQESVTIEPGCNLIFDIGAVFKVWKTSTSTGKLVAIGTATQPITFSGQTPTAGYWEGIDIRAGDVKMDYCQIRDAGKVGASSSNYGSIHCTQVYSPILVSVSNCTISNSSGHGFSIQNAASPNVTLSGNLFSGIAGQNLKYY